jgi:hypothetical protein
MAGRAHQSERRLSLKSLLCCADGSASGEGGGIKVAALFYAINVLTAVDLPNGIQARPLRLYEPVACLSQLLRRK